MAQFTVYSSADGSAPTLNGNAGSLVTVLHAILVAGYGSKAAAGWSSAFTGTNTEVYRMGSGTQFYLSVNDNGPGAGTGKEARLQGFEVATGVGTGSGAFPSATQGVSSSGFLVTRKSVSADGVTRQWMCFADDKTVYFMALTGDTANTYLGFMFGDFYSLAGSGDAYRCMIIAREIENSGTIANDRIDLQQIPGTAISGHYIARTAGGGGASVTANKHGDIAKTNSSINAGMGTNGIQTPNSPDNSYYVSPVWVGENSAAIVRGRLRGMWHLCHSQTGFTDGQTFTGTNDVAGRNFQVLKLTGTTGMVIFETSATLDTN